MPDGTTHLLFRGMELLRRLASLVPPPRMNLTRFHGVFAPGAKLRPFLVAAAARPGEEEAPAAAGVGPRSRRQRAPRLDWAGLLLRVFKVDVFCCARGGGRRRVLASLTHAAAIRLILQHLKLPDAPAPLAPALGPAQQALWRRAAALRQHPSALFHGPSPCARVARKREVRPATRSEGRQARGAQPCRSLQPLSAPCPLAPHVATGPLFLLYARVPPLRPAGPRLVSGPAPSWRAHHRAAALVPQSTAEHWGPHR